MNCKNIFRFKKIDEQTKVGLANATFILYGKNGFKQKRTTGPCGYVEFDNLCHGYYSIKEIEAPDGYELNTEIIEIYIDSCGNVYILNENYEIPNSRIYVPKCKVTIFLKDGKGFFELPNIEITLNNGIKDTDYYTDTDGKIELELEDGEYIIKQTSCLEHYIEYKQTHLIKVVDGIAIIDNFENNILIIYNNMCPNLKIITESETGTIIANAKFKLISEDGITVSEETTDSLGEAYFRYLNEGIYTLQQIDTPITYHKDTSIYSIRVDMWGFIYINESHIDTLIIKNIRKRINIVANKIWDDNNDSTGMRIGVVDIQLFQNGNYLETAYLVNPEFTHTFTPVQYDDDGNLYNYTIDEPDVPEGYTKSVFDFTIINEINSQYVVVYHKDAGSNQIIAEEVFYVYYNETKTFYAKSFIGYQNEGNTSVTLYNIREDKEIDFWYRRLAS